MPVSVRGILCRPFRNGFWVVKAPFVVDFQFRYGRIFADGKGINLSRTGIGLGVRF